MGALMVLQLRAGAVAAPRSPVEQADNAGPVTVVADEDAPPMPSMAAPPATPTATPPPRDPRIGLVPRNLELGMTVAEAWNVCPDMYEVGARGSKRVFAAPSCVTLDGDLSAPAQLAFRNDRLVMFRVTEQWELAVNAAVRFAQMRSALRAVHGKAACRERSERVCIDGDLKAQVNCILGSASRVGPLVNDGTLLCAAKYDHGTRAIAISAAANPAGPLPWVLTAVYGSAAAGD